ncbi:hypothetical protein Vretimale_7611 [Volvox reticuliferus]|uniref:Uncharacterized protein n=1 Tax=Volvox reticuliferus TaxID=1737510 RepID=A0A8J4CB29_9CHLO|nr:hypothetical protein Vretifemale_7665 [Volvox reticuliferus]GIM02773.1 hypothetical protein Vretimale_7611 [Volvox reticuliferus]
MAVAAILGIASVITALYFSSNVGTNRFVPNACTNVDSLLSDRIVGQDAAISSLVSAVCEHIRERPGGDPVRPLVISVHGPPGTGKTYTHTLLARAMYNRDPSKALSCPGPGCTGVKVLYGMSYIESEQETQLEMVRRAVMEHIRSTPDPILVIEEYDKLDCKSRAMLRQLVRHHELIDEDKGRMIIFLESNLGFMELVNLVTTERGNKSRITQETTDRILRQVSLDSWLAASCESLEDTVAFATTIHQYLAFLPLTRQDMAVLVGKELAHNYARRVAALGAELTWDPTVVQWLLNKGDYDQNNFPLDGAAQVASLCVRYVARHFRMYEIEQRNKLTANGIQVHKARVQSLERLRLSVAPGGGELQLRAGKGG